MPVSDKEHFDALRAADQKAIELLAMSNSERTKNATVMASILVSIISVILAIATLSFHLTGKF